MAKKSLIDQLLTVIAQAEPGSYISKSGITLEDLKKFFVDIDTIPAQDFEEMFEHRPPSLINKEFQDILDKVIGLTEKSGQAYVSIDHIMLSMIHLPAVNFVLAANASANDIADLSHVLQTFVANETDAAKKQPYAGTQFRTSLHDVIRRASEHVKALGTAKSRVEPVHLLMFGCGDTVSITGRFLKEHGFTQQGISESINILKG